MGIFAASTVDAYTTARSFKKTPPAASFSMLVGMPIIDANSRMSARVRVCDEYNSMSPPVAVAHE